MPADNFKIGKKWFWVGLVSCINPLTGLVFGIALAAEPKHRQEGTIIIAATIAWLFISLYVIGPVLRDSGLLPKFQIVQ